MSEPDVVAAIDVLLDLWRTAIAERPSSAGAIPAISPLLQEARDEIVALRGFRDETERQYQEKVAEIGGLYDRLREARAEGLEEAARIAHMFAEPEISDSRRMNECRTFALQIEAAIRALILKESANL